MTEQEAIKKGFVPVQGYENYYMVDKNGNVFGIKRGKIMTPVESNNGYLQVHLTKDGKAKSCKIHRLVAQAFIPNPYNLPQVNHKDENKKNNNVENLEWCTQSYNMSYKDGQKRRAKSRNYEDISKKRSDVQSKEVTQYDYDGRIIAIWKNAYMAENHGYNRTMINQCCLGNKKSHKGFLWKYSNNIEKQIPKRPVYEADGYADGELVYDYAECPECGHLFEYGINDWCCNHCSDCGQKLDWTVGE